MGPVASFSGAFKGNGHTISDVSLVGAYSPAASSASWKRAVPFRTLPSRVWSIPLVPRRPQAVWWGTNYGTIINCTFSGAVHGEERRRAVWWAAMRRAGTIDHSTSRAMVSGAYATGGIVATTSVSSPAAPMWAPSTPSIRESAPRYGGPPAHPAGAGQERIWAMTSNNISNVSSDTAAALQAAPPA